jgi:energy-coupling factor transporter ATP-binding protein EcfA2
MTKIKSLKIKGLRGIKEELTLDLDKKSILLYGENGSGKSSITDTFEWFYKNRIGHLCGEEISRSKLGVEALRNIFLKDDEKGVTVIEFSNKKYNSEKAIFYKKDSFPSEHSNQSEEFAEYLSDSQKENLLLRYGDLVEFILASKKEKLDTLSGIIGFSEVAKTRNTLRRIANDLARDLKGRDFDNRINNQKAKIIEQLGSGVTSDEKLVEAVNELIKPLKIVKEITQISEINDVLEKIKKPEDAQIIDLQSFYNRIADWVLDVQKALAEIEDLYGKYHKQFQKIISDIEKISKILLERLLSEGVRVIKEDVIKEDYCPLCLQPKNRNQLLHELESRIAELQQTRKEKQILDELNGLLEKDLRGQIHQLKLFLSEKFANTEENRELKEKIESSKSGFENYSTQLKIEISPSQTLKAPEALIIDRETLDRIADFCKKRIDKIKESRKGNLRDEIYDKLLLSQEAYLEIKKLKKQKESLERQQRSLELIYSEFLKKQKEALESFLTRFSNDINELYQFMNPDEKVEDIRLIPLEKDDELVGLTLEFKFYKNSESPPQKYLSESHLNCQGIAFFLTSVIAFNKKNKFFILDDVISSFDTDHRKRFADLLIEKFSDYQVILMTHESNWFQLVRHSVRGKGWKVNTIKWDKKKGAYIDEPLKNLKEKIEVKIEAGEVEGLGNNIRKYLEHFLKEVWEKLGVKARFRFNDKNEDRMLGELLDELKSYMKKTELIDDPKFMRILSSIFIGNKDSHDSLYEVSMGDLKAFWKDVEDFEGLFLCCECGKYIASKIDTGKKLIRCSCGKLNYESMLRKKKEKEK